MASCSRQLERPEAQYVRALASFHQGALPQALLLARTGVAQNPSRSSPWFWQFALLEAEALLGQSKPDQALKLIELPVPAVAGFDQLEARRLIDKALARLKQRKPGEALEILASVEPRVTDDELLIRIRILQGSMLDDPRDHGPAEAKTREAFSLATKRGMDYYRAQALLNLGHFKKEENQYSAALDLDGQALALAQKGGFDQITAGVLLNLGYLEAFFGEFDQAVQYEQRAVDTFTRIDDEPRRVRAVGELGLVLSIQKKEAAAIVSYQKAFDAVKQGASESNREDASRFAGNLALAYINLKNWDKAAEWNHTAETIGNESSKPYVLMNAARIALGRGQRDLFFELCRKVLSARDVEPDMRWAPHEAMALAYAASADYTNARVEYRRAVDVVEQTRSELLQEDSRITFLSRVIALYQEYVETLVRDNRADEALRVIESSRARVLTERFGAAGKARTGTAWKPSNSVLLSYWLAPERSYLWVISRGATRRFDLPPEEEIAAAVTEYKRTTETDLKDPVTFSENHASPLWRTLLEKAAPLIQKNGRVVVVPDGPLHQLNLETLVVPGARPHYWLEDVELAVAPSLALAPSFAPSRAEASTVLLIGAPDYSGVPFAPLPYANAELKAIQADFPTPAPTVFRGLRATPAAYRSSAPGGFRMIHFAAHAVVDRESPLESAVILSPSGGDYRLYARDILNIPLNAELVTVSACRSAGARSYAGEGLIGFAWAFLGAGARNVIGGLWDADDESTSELMAKLYAGVATGMDPVSALHDAKLQLIKENWRKPFYWGPFQVYAASRK